MGNAGFISSTVVLVFIQAPAVSRVPALSCTEGSFEVSVTGSFEGGLGPRDLWFVLGLTLAFKESL